MRTYSTVLVASLLGKTVSCMMAAGVDAREIDAPGECVPELEVIASFFFCCWRFFSWVVISLIAQSDGA